jgi:manganese-dependent inorganic pyrophosphatase
MNKPTFIASYFHPDLDGFACIFAYREFLKGQGVEVLPLYSSPKEEANYLINLLNIKFSPIQYQPDCPVILVDASETISLPFNVKPENVIEIIDHRPHNEAHAFPNARIQIEMVGAAATLIGEKFLAADFKPSKNAALLLYSAIASNTLNFRSATLTNRDQKMADWLKKLYTIDDKIIYDMFAAKSDLSGDKLIKHFLKELAVFSIAGKRSSIIQLEIIGGRQLIKNRLPEIVTELNRQKENLKLDSIFLSIVELEENANYFITDLQPAQKMLQKIFQIHFENNVARRPGFIMRKEIVPLLKDYWIAN